MGTLDDAIREHLELKRRLGASDEELEKKESEAFGKGGPPAPPPPDSEPEPPGAALDDELFEPDEVPPEESLDPMTVRDQRSASGPEDAVPAEDVLEETPEFLEETPESDRLWFEQRPPKDFDFD